MAEPLKKQANVIRKKNRVPQIGFVCTHMYICLVVVVIEVVSDSSIVQGLYAYM